MYSLKNSNIIFVLALSRVWSCPVISEPSTSLTNSVFTATQHCMVEEGIVDTSETISLVRCARKCSDNQLCAAFGFQESDGICRLGEKVSDHMIYSDHCIVGQTIYASVMAQIRKCDIEDGWFHNSIRNTCIKVFLLSMTRIGAQSSCESHDSSLAVWNSAESKDEFRRLVESNTAGWLSNGGSIWTDAMKINGKWQWSSGEEVADTDWAPGEPNGSGDCASVIRIDSQPELFFKLYDKGCNLLRQYVCEKGGF